MKVDSVNDENRVQETNLEDLHRVLIMMAIDLDNFCRKHDIQYYLMGGTALGAMRHQGFIPWDDDFDVFMDRNNYVQFLTACENDLDTQKYFLQREDTKEWPLFFSKIRLNGTKYHEASDLKRDIHKGIYIDIMCLNNCYRAKSLRYFQYLSGRILSATALAKRGYETKSQAKKIALLVAKAFAIPFVKQRLLWGVRHLNARPTKYIGHFFGRAPFHATSFASEVLGVPRYVQFESTELPVPQNVEVYLATRFGSKYMEPPTQEIIASYPSHSLGFELGQYEK